MQTKLMQTLFLIITWSMGWLAMPICWGLTFSISHYGNLVGEVQVSNVCPEESLGDIGRRFDLGIYEMIEANPQLDPWVPHVGAEVIVPSRFILPNEPQQGMVINLAEMRIYYFHGQGQLVSTYPIGIGKKGWQTPLAKGKIIGKKEKPTWHPPQSIRAAHAQEGDILPESVPPGPDNPLGEYALRLSIPGYMIHGTNRPGGIGVRSSNGCIRLFPEDIATLFHQVAVEDPVNIIYAPFKFGVYKGQIFLEAHQPLSDAHYYKTNYDLAALKRELLAVTANIIPSANFAIDTHIDWSRVEQELHKARGFPVLISKN
jgi:L,D-transpeptidase ErfK/SrfK